MTDIVLATLNARYAHASLGLRYLRANLGELRERSLIREFIIGQKTEDIVEAVLADAPRILGLGVYIWNVDEATRLVAQLKCLRPDLLVVLGGPEVSHEPQQQAICALADYVITGWGEVSFAELCRRLLAGERPASKWIAGHQAALRELVMPYAEFSEEDIARRYIYVEASRGCPFKCEFCLSALDKTAWPFPLPSFLAELGDLYRRGVRQFKFVDRTFNLKVDTSRAILEFFLDRLREAPEDPVFAHFELVPDHLPERLKALISQFPPGTLQFEIGIQTFNPEVQALISRRQNNDVACENLRWLRQHSHAHLHVDLIAGLPGEDVDSFARGFDTLVALAPHEIQFGILKRLRGAPIARHAEDFALRFNPAPPYNILQTDRIDFATLQRLSRFARYWDIVANSGRFPRATRRLLGTTPFANFLSFSDWLYAQTGQTHSLSPERLVHRLHAYLLARGDDETGTCADLVADYRSGGGRSRLAFEADDAPLPAPRRREDGAVPKRQARHLRASPG